VLFSPVTVAGMTPPAKAYPSLALLSAGSPKTSIIGDPLGMPA
jgi:hypothetical protein